MNMNRFYVPFFSPLSFLLSLTILLYSIKSLAEESMSLTGDASSTLSTLSVVNVSTTNDALFHGSRTYRGYKMKDVIAKLFPQFGDGSVIKVTCSDGFTVLLPSSSVKSKRLFLVAKELSESIMPWTRIREGKSEQDAGPFALVWEGEFSNQRGEPWPHGIVSLTLTTDVAAFGPTFPHNTSRDVRKGFLVYREACMSCHSVNLHGGVVGPELNVPRNVTEYWTKDHFQEFVKNPASYRWRTRMMTEGLNLKDVEINDVYTYLKSMKTQKVCNSPKSCKAYEDKVSSPPSS
jgi:cytochrome c2